jgi:hypothetical protein
MDYFDVGISTSNHLAAIEKIVNFRDAAEQQLPGKAEPMGRPTTCMHAPPIWYTMSILLLWSAPPQIRNLYFEARGRL